VVDGHYEALAAAIQDDIAAGYHNGGCGPIETIAPTRRRTSSTSAADTAERQRLANAAAADDRSTLPTLAGYSFTDDGSLNPPRRSPKRSKPTNAAPPTLWRSGCTTCWCTDVITR
jgi:hypothetical protein